MLTSKPRTPKSQGFTGLHQRSPRPKVPERVRALRLCRHQAVILTEKQPDDYWFCLRSFENYGDLPRFVKEIVVHFCVWFGQAKLLVAHRVIPPDRFKTFQAGILFRVRDHPAQTFDFPARQLKRRPVFVLRFERSKGVNADASRLFYTKKYSADLDSAPRRSLVAVLNQPGDFIHETGGGPTNFLDVQGSFRSRLETLYTFQRTSRDRRQGQSFESFLPFGPEAHGKITG